MYLFSTRKHSIGFTICMFYYKKKKYIYIYSFTNFYWFDKTNIQTDFYIC